MDYARQHEDDGRVHLDEELHNYLKEQGRTDFDVVAFSHADEDHVQGAEDFFWLEQSPSYQDSHRIKIKDLHIPANFLLEPNLEGSALVIRQEARHRLKEGHGIRVYGEPDSLKAFLEEAGIDPDDRSHLISRAGQLVPGFSNAQGAAEIFIHSPFTFRVEEDGTDRNENSLVWHITFFGGDRKCRLMLGADAEHQAWTDIVNLSKSHDNEQRLAYDLFRISHHCSYTALAEEKGETETEPRPEVAELFENAQENCILVSSSQPIPEEDTDQPPHRQAAAYYERIADERGSKGNFMVTMQWPTLDRPRPLIIDLDMNCFAARKTGATLGGIASVIRRPSPRVGPNERIL